MTLSILLGIVLGVTIGGAFAWLQLLAARRNEMIEKQQPVGILQQVPGSMGRVALLLMALVVVQVVFPTANKWWLSGSLVIAYGIPFFWRLKYKLSQAH
ncbi:MAG TPA: hypothetical protein VL171_05215 [Verrucomicrobiae bacterium]|nr:hypothetical protein [Verrucomicrobiae bacterium]